MKISTKFLIIFIIALHINIYPQIVNGNFEEWVDENTPQNWIANNVPGVWITVTRSSTAAMGSFAAQLQVANFSGNPVFPSLQTFFFPVNEAYGSMMGYYQFQPSTNSEILYLQAWFWGDEGTGAGFGSIEISSPAASYTQFNFNIEHFENNIPDSAWVLIGIIDTSEAGTPSAGATALVDELTFGPATGLNEISKVTPKDYNLQQNFPNPFNPTTKIEFSIPKDSFVELNVYDVLGKQVSLLANDNYVAGTYQKSFDGTNLPSGIYIVKIKITSKEVNFSKSMKMSLIK